MAESVAVCQQVLLCEQMLDRRLRLAFGVFAEHVHLDVERAAWGKGVQTGRCVGVRNDGDLDILPVQRSDRQADAFDGDRALGDDVAGECFGDTKTESPVGLRGIRRDGVKRNQSGGAVDVALHDVAAKGRSSRSGQLEVHD